MLHRTTIAVLIALVIFAMACATPLGPGFHTEKEFLEVRFVPGAPPHLAVRATFALRNSGNVPLDSIEFSLPDEKDFGLQNLRIHVDGTAISPQSSAGARESVARVPLAAPWSQKALHTLVISYDLTKSSDSESHLGIAESSFFLPAEAWYPLPRAPKGSFAKGSGRPGRFDLSVLVPDGFLVHAAGQSKGKRRRAGESEFRFRLREDDFSPFVVAGRYHEQKFSDSSATVIFWTFQPLPSDLFQRSAARLVAALGLYDTWFGPRARTPRPVHIIEGTAADPGPWHGRVVPDGVLLDTDVFRMNALDSIGSLHLARLWFGQSLTARPEARLLLGPAAASYAVVLVNEAREGESARRRLAVELLEQYDVSLKGRQEKPVVGDFGRNPDVLSDFPSGTTSLERTQRDVAIVKGALFFLALEDEYGKPSVHHALARVIRDMRGQEAGIHELRAALEAETAKPLGEFFRLWLNHPDIPADFRARYAGQKPLERK